MDIPAGLIRVETSETLQGFVLVVPGSPEHLHFARTADDTPDAPAPKRKR